jgi:type VI protein secretion system component VasF
MNTTKIPRRLTVVVIALVIVLTPVVLLTLTLSFLTATGSIVAGELTPLEIAELYLLDLGLLLGVGYLLYRLSLRLASEELPASLDALAETEAPAGREEPHDPREPDPE